MQPTRIQDILCIHVFDGIAPNLPVVHRLYIALIALATAFSIAWYKIT